MDFKLTAEQEKLERDARYYLENKMPAGLMEELEAEHFEGGGPIYKQALKQLGSDKWLGLGWPKEYGGQNRSPIEQYIFFGLAGGYYRIPIPMLTINAVGPVIMRYGTPEQKKYFLPKILNGDLIIAVGYTEPEAGSDLASLQTKAVKDGDYYVINGEKKYTTMGQFCDYIWLAVRTDPQAPKHKGISMFLVDSKTPGINIKILETMSPLKTTNTFYENVRVPKTALVGEENKGWIYINHQLGGERVGLSPHYAPLRYLNDITKWVAEHGLSNKAVIRNRLAERAVETEIIRLLNFRAAWMLAQGKTPHIESAMTKVFACEQAVRFLGDCLDIMGPYGLLQTGSKWVPFRGRLEYMLRISVVNLFGGGANDILRDIVAMGKGLPVSR